MRIYHPVLEKTAWGIIGLAAALALKAHYSGAHAENLLWILGPVAFFVEILTGCRFYFDPANGYVSHALGVVIAPACAGVNFMIAMFCLVYFSGIFKFTRTRENLLWLAGSAGISYLSAIIANTARIDLSIIMITHNIHLGWLTPLRVHRITGILIYFFFLNLVYHIIRKNYVNIFRFLQSRQSADLFRTKTRADVSEVRWIWPFFWYWGITLGVPLINGAPIRNPAGFVEHGLTVGGLTLAVFFGWILFNCFTALLQKQKLVTPDDPCDSDHRR